MSSAITRIPIKIITLISLLLSITLLAVCSWTLTGIFHHPQEYENSNPAIERTQDQGHQDAIKSVTAETTPVPLNAVEVPPALLSPSKNAPPPSAPASTVDTTPPLSKSRRRRPIQDNVNQNEKTPPNNVGQEQEIEISRPQLHEESNNLDRYTEKSKPTPTEHSRILPTFINMEGDYKWLTTGCLCGSMLAGLIQCISSLFALCSYSKDISYRMRLWVILQCIVFLILVITILVPLTYDPVKQQHLKMDEILPHTHTRMFYSIFDSEKSVHETLLHDFNAYFIVTILNEAFLLVFTISICCLVKCGEQSYQPIRN